MLYNIDLNELEKMTFTLKMTQYTIQYKSDLVRPIAIIHLIDRY